MTMTTGMEETYSASFNSSADFEVSSFDDNGIDVMEHLEPEEPSTKEVDERISATADSPYFSAFCDKEIDSLQTLGDALQDISDRTRTFVRTGAVMSEAARRLAVSCRLQRELSPETEEEERMDEEAAQRQRKDAVGEEMARLLALLGEVRLCF